MRINEIFYSLQGEGYYTGTPAVFIRFSGCNLKCPFCDTKHEEGTEMTEEEIVADVGKYPARHVVITGGEPALQLTASLVDNLHSIDRYVAVETNGTKPLPDNVDWITLSPKDAWLDKEASPTITHADELKLLFDGQHEPAAYDTIAVSHRFLQPCDMGDTMRNTAIVAATVDYIKSHPQWRLSLQIHKTLNIK